MNKLKTFYMVYSTGAVGEAAAVLGLTPGAVSISLKELERSLRAPLFCRIGKKLIPTEAGQKLFTLIDPFFRRLESFLLEVQGDSKNVRGTLKIGISAGLGANELIRVFSIFRQKYPEVSFTLRTGNSSLLLPLLANNGLDFVMSLNDRAIEKQTQFSTQALYTKTLAVICSPDFRKTLPSGEFALDTLPNLNHVLLIDSTEHVEHWYAKLFKGKVSIKHSLLVDSLSSLISGTIAGLGVTLLSPDVVRDEIRAEKLLVLSSKPADFTIKYQLVQLAGKVPSFTERAFLKFLKEHLNLPGLLVE